MRYNVGKAPFLNRATQLYDARQGCLFLILAGWLSSFRDGVVVAEQLSKPPRPVPEMKTLCP